MTAVWVAVLVAVVGLAYYGMWSGWRNRGRRNAVPEPRWLDEGSLTIEESIPATYVSTTTAGNWLDRITAHGLGAISKSSLAVGDGALLVQRRGARGFAIPGADILAVARAQGIAGKVRDKEGLIVITWRLGSSELDTGVRPSHKADVERVERLVAELMEGATHG